MISEISDTWLSFTVQLVATLIGAFVGFGLVIAWDRKQKKRTIQETRISVINSIKQELEENQKGLEYMIENMPAWSNTEGRFKGDFGLASTPAFESAVGGGDFLLLPKDLQQPVREAYHNFKLFNEFMTDIIRFSSFHFTTEQASKEANNLINRLLERINVLRPVLNELLPKLEFPSK